MVLLVAGATDKLITILWVPTLSNGLLDAREKFHSGVASSSIIVWVWTLVVPTLPFEGALKVTVKSSLPSAKESLLIAGCKVKDVAPEAIVPMAVSKV